MRFLRVIAVGVAGATLSTTSAFAGKTSSLASLTLEQALVQAREHLPALRAAAAQRDSARARAGTALAPLLPSISTAINYSRSTANFVARPGQLPNSLATASSISIDSFDFYSASLNAQLTLWDFGQSWYRWQAAKENVAAAEESLRGALITLGLQVRTSYFSAAAARELADVADAALKNTETHAMQIAALVRVGSRPPIDLAQSRADVANARVASAQARTGYATARARLNQAMGVDGPTSYEVGDDTLPQSPLETTTVDLLVDEACSARPELAALAAQTRAQEFSLRSLRGAYGPSLSAQLSGTLQARTLSQIAPNVSAGVVLNWPLYQGGSTLSQVAEAQSTLAELEAKQATLRGQLRVDVEEALAEVAGARDALAAATEAVDAANEQLKLAEGRYGAGSGNIIELADAQTRQTRAASGLVQARYTLSAARARLWAAIGRQ